MLAALIALSIPWIIEWLFRRKRRIVPFPALRFLLDAQQQQKVRLQDLILLVVRTLAILLLVVALTRPVLRPDPLLPPGERALNVLMIFDASYSNSQSVGSESAIALARKIGSEVVGSLPRRSKVTLAVLTDKVSVPVDGSEDLPAVREHVEQIQASDKAGHMIDAVEWAEKYMVEKKITACETYIFSDMQQSSWSRQEGDHRDLKDRFRKFCEKNRVFVSDTGGDRITNYYVTRFEPRERIMAVEMPATFDVSVEATNLEEGRENRAQLTFYVDGAKQDSQEFVMGSATHNATFKYTFQKPQRPSGARPEEGKDQPMDDPRYYTHVLKVELKGDGHLMDNARCYIASVPESHRVLIVDERAQKPLFDRDSGLLELAVAPPRKAGFDKVSVFLATAKTPAQFSHENLTNYKVVILTNLSEVPPQMVSALELFVNEGRAVLVLLGESVVPFEYNKKLYKEGKGLLPCAVVEASKGPVAADQQMVTVDPGIARLFGSITDKSELESAVRKHVELEVAPSDKTTRVLARLGATSPLLVEKPFGRGRVLLFAGTVNPSWGDLPLSGQFPVIVQEALRYLVGDPDRDVNLEVGGVFDQPVMMVARHLALKRPDNRKARLTPVAQEGQQVRHIRYAETDRTGVYEVDTIEEVLARRRFVVNLIPSESDLRRLDEPKFEAAFGRPAVRFLPPAARVRRYIEELHSVKEAAGVILIALFFLLAVETYLAVRFGMRRI